LLLKTLLAKAFSRKNDTSNRMKRRGPGAQSDQGPALSSAASRQRMI
jgi:hypothetical protein